MSDKNNGHAGHFIVPAKYYLGTLGFLLLMTVITVMTARIDLGGSLNIIVAMGIAVLKATSVLLFFMGLWYEKGFNRVIIISTFIFLGIFILFTVADMASRGYVDPIQEKAFKLKSPVKLIEAGAQDAGKSAH